MKDLRQGLLFPLSLTAVAVGLSGCGWVDSSGRQENRDPGLTELTQLILEDRESSSLGVVDEDGNLVSVDYVLVSQGDDLNALCVAAGGVLAEVDEADFEPPCDPDVEAPAAGACDVLELEVDLVSSELWVSNTPVLRRPVAQQYRVFLQDSDGATSEQLLTLCIASESTAPTAEPDQYDVQYNEVRTVDGMVFDAYCGPDSASGVLSNDSDDFDYTEDDANEQQCLVAELLAPPAMHVGEFELDSDGGFSYGAGTTLGVGGTDSFTYRVTDGVNFSDATTVSIHVTDENTAPVATNPSLTVNEGEAVTLTAADLATDTGPGAISVVSVSEPSAEPPLGVIDWNSAAVIYTANESASGEDSFEYTVEDAGGAAAAGEVSVLVNALPTIVAEEGLALALTAGETGALLFSVDDIEDAVEELTVLVVSSNEAVVTVTEVEELDLSTDGNWQVDFEAIAEGSANVSVSVIDSDGASNSDPLTVVVNVAAAPTAAPVIASPDLNATVGVPVVFNISADGLATDSDSDNATLTFDGVPTALGQSIELSNSDTSFGFTPTAAGTVSVNVTIVDEDGNSVSGSLDVEVAEAGTEDPVLAAPTLNATVGTLASFDISVDGLATDADSDVSSLVFIGVPTASTGETMTLEANAKGFSFTPAASGTTTVTVTIEDPDGNSVTGTLTVNVVDGEADPELSTAALAATAGQLATYSISADALASDADSDVSSLVFSGGLTASSGEAITLDGDAKGFSFTPVASGVTTVAVTIEDPDGNSVAGNLTVNVAEADPELSTAALTATAGESASFNITADALATDTDSAVSSLVFSGALAASTGEVVTLDGDAKGFSFTPLASGATIVSVTIEDPDGNSVAGSLVVNVVDP